MRAVVPEDKSAIQGLVPHHEALMEDLDLFFHRDPVSLDSDVHTILKKQIRYTVQCNTLFYESFYFFHPQDVQAFVAQVEGQIIGVLVIKNEQVIIFTLEMSNS